MTCPDHRWSKDDDLSDPIFGLHYHHCAACDPHLAWFLCDRDHEIVANYDNSGPAHRGERRTCPEHYGRRLFGGKPRCPHCGTRDEDGVQFDGFARELPQMNEAEDVRLVVCVNCVRTYKVIRQVVVTHEAVVLEEKS